MKGKPILFTAPMVRALLAGTKTQTRRVVKPQPFDDSCAGQPMVGHRDLAGTFAPSVFGSCMAKLAPCPYGAVGELLWVRETWTWPGEGEVLYRADPQAEHLVDHWKANGFPVVNWRPSIFMQRQHSRITLRITEVRVQRLQQISQADAQAEGIERESADPPFYYVPGLCQQTAVGVEERQEQPEVVCYSRLWTHINGAGSWAANPWVWALTFEVINNNIDGAIGG